MRPPLPFLLAAFLFGALLLAACESPPAITEGSAPTDTTVTDDLGRAVSFAHPPQRLLALAPSLTEMVFAVGAGDRLVAASPADNHPPQVRTLPTFSTFPLDHEGVVALAPDLLLATDQINSVTDAGALATVGVPTAFLRFETVADVPRAMRRLGALLGTDGDTPARAFEARVDSIRTAAEGREAPRTLLLVGDDVLYAFGRDSYASEAIRIAGGENLTDVFEGQAATLSDEWVLDAAPEVIVVLVEGYDPATLLEKHPTWRLLPAVRDERVYGLHPDLLSRPGPRLAQGIETLWQHLHRPGAPR